jgi:hypothetical protein
VLQLCSLVAYIYRPLTPWRLTEPSSNGVTPDLAMAALEDLYAELDAKAAENADGEAVALGKPATQKKIAPIVGPCASPNGHPLSRGRLSR